VIAAFLLVGLLGMVPEDIKGKWYEVNGYDYEYEFLTFDKLEYSGLGETHTGSYTYDAKTKTGVLTSDEQGVEDRVFTYDNATITMEPSIFTRKVVEQFDPEKLFNQMKDELDNLVE
jgi:hypothetical protein